MGAKKLEDQLVEYAINGEKTGLKLLDCLISDALDEERMATDSELSELRNIVKHKLVLIKND